MTDTGRLIAAMHAYLDEGGDVDTLMDCAALVAQERGEDAA